MKKLGIGLGVFALLCLVASFQAQAVSSSPQIFMEVKQVNKAFATINTSAITYFYEQGNGTRVCFVNGSYIDVAESYVKFSDKVVGLRLR